MKKLLFPLLAILSFTACQKQINTETIPVSKTMEKVSAGANTPDNKIDVCHREGNGSWHTINIDMNALPAHLAHGDMVPDADGDGYTKTTPCGTGNDCDDNNAAINPGATEVCGNNIDDNCNGQVDENCTPSVTICDQTWMLYNLDVSKYRNGDDIPQASTNDEWYAAGNAGIGAWCYYENNSSNGTIYGKLYNWYAVNDPRGLAPTGWHVPTYAEWITLENCLEHWGVAGGKMKETGTTHWQSPNTDATNSSGFTGLPGGFRFFWGSFGNLGIDGRWWISEEVNTYSALLRSLAYSNSILGGGYESKLYGFSVRCIRD